ncbi:acyl-CoA dehydrogenase family protein [Alloalcanivorax xenomutans]|uniref:acyl-CoA dehydrogenase family protein n=1 Tax=Alloalcanivorax xenomutans TaxID=1094342 RepID=UPI0009E7DE23|nr:acyl-CoA dehydrogenase family protein [Alloalcanivorax xenomutans]PHS64650.1 MAG: hypothetical protein COB00_11415 [Alcanivorax sp.]
MSDAMAQRRPLALGLSDDERQLQDSIERFIDHEYDLMRRRAALAEGGDDPALWRQIAELGWLGACLPETDGGYAQSPKEALILLEQFGRGPVLAPVLDAMVVPSAILRAAGQGEREAGLLMAMMSGERRLALAWAEPGRRYDLRPVTTQARHDGDQWRLQGAKATVLGAPQADTLLVSAAAEQGPVLMRVPADAPGLSMTSYLTIGGQPAADLFFADVRVTDDALVASTESAGAALQAGWDWGVAGACAEALGAMRAALTLTLEYVDTREQFSQRLSQFQVIQHRLAAMALELEYSQALLPLLTAHLDQRGERSSAVIAGVRSRISAAARMVTADAVQLHGGIGVTDEAAVSHYFRHVVALDQAWGGHRFHLQRYRQQRRDHDLIHA